MTCGSKFLTFTPILLYFLESRGSQCVVQPQVWQRTVRKVLSPWMYSSVFSGWP